MNTKEALHSQRRVLLDLTFRNRLLNLPKKPSARSVIIHGEASIELYRLLVTDRKSLSFSPIGGNEEGEELSTDEAIQDSDETSLAQPESDADVVARQTDLKLQTRLKSEHLQKRLLEIFYESRTMLEEQGVNVLYLALGELRFRDRVKLDEVRTAPLLLVPVQLERKSARERFVLKWNEEDAQENLSLREKLRVDFGLKVPDFPSPDAFDVRGYFDAMRELIALQKGWEIVDDAVQLGFFSFSKLLMFLDLDPEKWANDQRLDENELIAGLLGDGIASSRQQLGGSGSAFLDEIVGAARMKHVMDCDSSQALAIEEIRRGANLVIQGPPGTGKSQTIANIIATAVGDGKKVLFVAEKMAALEVVKRRLENVGLGALCLELHSNKANKKIVLEELARTLALGRPERADVSGTVDRLTDLRDQLNSHALKLHESNAGAALLSPFRIVGSLTKLLPLVGRPNFALPDAGTWTMQEAERRAALVDEYCGFLPDVGQPNSSPWRGISHAPVMRPVAEEMLSATQELPASIASALAAGSVLAAGLSLPAPDTLKGMRELAQMAEQLGKAPAFDRATISSSVWSAGLDALGEGLVTGRRLAAIHIRRSTQVVDSAWDMDWTIQRSSIAAHGGSLFRWFNGGYRAAVQTLRGVASSELPKTQRERLDIVDDLIAGRKAAARLHELDSQASGAFGSVWKGEATDWDLADSVLAWVAAQAKPIGSVDVRVLAATISDRSTLTGQANVLHGAYAGVERVFAAMVERFGFDRVVGLDGNALENAALANLQERFAGWPVALDGLLKWMAFADTARRVRDAGLNQAVDALSLSPENWTKAVDYFWAAFYLQLLAEATKVYPDLAKFDGRRHDALVKEFREWDRRRLRVAQVEAAQSHFTGIPSHSGANLGVFGILTSEIGRKRGHMSLRKLIRLCASPIQATKPVFMMSPLSIAQFLEPGAIEFDLLVIDEASQVEPVDALGAIARCKQIVVVGDDKQLPPTSFFSRIVDSEELDEVEEGAQAKDLESILSLCAAKGIPQRMLQWHYRSRHESLIATSNKEFYEGKLFIVPSPDRGRAQLGLKFHHLPNGRFDRGNSYKNHVEALTIAQAVVDHARMCPEKTLGVGAMSVRQRQAITDEIELARRQHPELEHFFSAHPHEPFFVKNLENIQGDERDVIFISIGYGRSKSDDKLYQNFGPLNADGGHRRLNVLITRAKERCEVFSSIVANDIRIDERSKAGLVALKTFLKYAESGDLGVPTMTGRGADSPFEEAVQAVLTQHGFQVDNQVGIAGFFIDLAVVDPETPGRYLLGIECDGAAYHSAPSARDRDRLRQEILEANGWTIHRIWSTDWFQHCATETDRLLQAIAAARSRSMLEAAKPVAAPVPVSMPVPAPQPLIRREAPRLEAAAEESIAQPYRQANFAPGNPSLEPHEVPVPSMAHTVTKIIEIEGPIHEDEIVARVRDLWKLGRAGSRIQAAVFEALEYAGRNGAISSESLCYVVTGAPILIRDRSNAASRSLKKPELLPPQEIREAILRLALASHGIQREQVAVAVGRLLGFGATSRQLRELIDAQIEVLKQNGQMAESGGVIDPSGRASVR